MMIADRAEERGVPAMIFTGQAFILRELAPNRDKYRVLLKPLRPREILAAVTDALESWAVGRCQANSALKMLASRSFLKHISNPMPQRRTKRSLLHVRCSSILPKRE
jgi:hypothetical protein